MGNSSVPRGKEHDVGAAHIRMSSLKELGVAVVSYAREPTGPEWVLVADVARPETCDFDPSGCESRIDFSPKGGPRDVIAIWSPNQERDPGGRLPLRSIATSILRSVDRFFDRLIDSSIGD